jgi:hypothetical protein
LNVFVREYISKAKKNGKSEPGMVVHTRDPSNGQVEAGESSVGTSLGYIVRPCLNLKRERERERTDNLRNVP